MCPPSKPKEWLGSIIIPNQTAKISTRPPPSLSNEDYTPSLPTTTNNTQKVTTILPPSTSDVQTITTMYPPQTPEKRQQYDNNGAPTLKANDGKLELLFEEVAV